MVSRRARSLASLGMTRQPATSNYMPQRPVYDVCIIGSGAGGGMAAYALTKAGARVVMLEAGASWFASRDSKMMVPSYATPHRGAAIHGRPFGEFDACDGGWEIDGEPFTRAPGTQFSWWRARMLGGRTNHWGRISLRFGPDDFRGKSIDGLGDDWPIGYDDVKPYYDQHRSVHRPVRQQRRAAQSSRRHLHAAAQAALSRAARQESVGQAEHHVHPSASVDHRRKRCPGRQACHYCGECNRGCSVKANFSSPDVLIAPALADREAHADHERDGARGHRRTRRPGERRLVHRQEHRHRRARAREDRRARRERAASRRGCY